MNMIALNNHENMQSYPNSSQEIKYKVKPFEAAFKNQEIPKKKGFSDLKEKSI